MAYVVTRTGQRYRGLGDDLSAGQISGAGQGAAAGALQIIGSNTVGGKISGAGTMIMSVAPFVPIAGPAVMIVGAVVTVAGKIIQFVGWGDGCGQNCILASNWANQAEDLLKANINAYFSSPVRNASTQQAALGGFDAIWAQLAKACGQASLGTAGKNCTGDRQAGACKWKQTGQSPWPGGPALGECWNWFSAYRDPIANDTGVVPDSMIDTSSVGAAVSSIFGTSATGSSSSLLPLLLIGGLIFVGLSL
jgi:hypothetical protein